MHITYDKYSTWATDRMPSLYYSTLAVTIKAIVYSKYWMHDDRIAILNAL
jgi:hypothetical protein